MAQYGEWTNSAVQGSACSYATLCNYNNGSQGLNTSALAASNMYILPTFNAPPGYNSVAQKVPSCSGYANMKNAYGNGMNGSGCGGQFVSRLCQ